MTHVPVFAGLVFDESDNPVEIAYVGDEPCYVVNDAGFRRHIPSEQVDRQVLAFMQQMIEGNENVIGEQAARMLGQDDIFSRAWIQNQLKNLDKQINSLLETGIPEEGRAYIGMMGFRITINIHGDVTNIAQPGVIDPGET